MDDEKTNIATLKPREAFPDKRGPGRPRGGTKPPGSGRAKGQRNYVSAKTKDDCRAVLGRYGPQIIRRLTKIAMGHQVQDGPGRKVTPSLATQMQAAALLAPKLVPNLQSQTVDLTSRVETRDLTDHELASWIAVKLEAGEQKEPVELDNRTSDPAELGDAAVSPERVEQSQPESAARAAERLALSKSIAPPPPPDPQARLNNYIDQQIEAQRTRPRVILRAGPCRR